jgi:5-enolpyruvylshikimate-3-phosphate synthase
MKNTKKESVDIHLQLSRAYYAAATKCIKEIINLILKEKGYDIHDNLVVTQNMKCKITENISNLLVVKRSRTKVIMGYDKNSLKWIDLFEPQIVDLTTVFFDTDIKDMINFYDVLKRELLPKKELC